MATEKANWHPACLFSYQERAKRLLHQYVYSLNTCKRRRRIWVLQALSIFAFVTFASTTTWAQSKRPPEKRAVIAVGYDNREDFKAAAGLMRQYFFQQGIPSSKRVEIGPRDFTLARIAADFKEQCKDLMAEDDEVHLAIGSHGEKGQVCSQYYSNIDYADLAKRLRKVIDETGTKARVFIHLSACYSGSILDAFRTEFGFKETDGKPKYKVSVAFSGQEDQLVYSNQFWERMIDGFSADLSPASQTDECDPTHGLKFLNSGEITWVDPATVDAIEEFHKNRGKYGSQPGFWSSFLDFTPSRQQIIDEARNRLHKPFGTMAYQSVLSSLAHIRDIEDEDLARTLLKLHPLDLARFGNLAHWLDRSRDVLAKSFGGQSREIIRGECRRKILDAKTDAWDVTAYAKILAIMGHKEDLPVVRIALKHLDEEVKKGETYAKWWARDLLKLVPDGNREGLELGR